MRIPEVRKALDVVYNSAIETEPDFWDNLMHQISKIVHSKYEFLSSKTWNETEGTWKVEIDMAMAMAEVLAEQVK